MNLQEDGAVATTRKIGGRSAGPELDVVVVGAGQAGLAMAYQLRATDLRFEVLESHARVGDSWRRRYDSLELFTPRSYSALPGLLLRGDPDGYAGKDEIADYLESYAARFELPIRLNSRVAALEHVNDWFRITTSDDGILITRAVVIASGAFDVPNIPALSAAFSADVLQVSAADYRNPGSLPAGTVLVAGDGATGRQIALELVATHRVALATGHRRQVVPNRVLGQSIFWWLDHLGLLASSRKSRVGHRLMSGDAFPGRRLTLGRLRKAGVILMPRLASADGKTAHFADGKDISVDSVVWATGYHDNTDWVKVQEALGPDGGFLNSRGRSPVPGLYFVGKSWQWTRGSALLFGVQADAAYVRTHLVADIAA
jgi:putative flavoprotein involved in K+ transport